MRKVNIELIMAEKKKVHEMMKTIVEKDSQYDIEAYYFVLDSLEYSLKINKKTRHISGKELLEGIRKYGLNEYGPMTKLVLSHWGVTNCSDFGKIVFNLIDVGLLKKSEEDSIGDFSNGYDFSEVFEAPFKN